MCSASRNSHSKFAVQAGRQAHKTFYHRHLLWSQYFPGFHFPTVALYVYCDHSQKVTPPPRRTRTPQVAPKLYPSLTQTQTFVGVVCCWTQTTAPAEQRSVGLNFLGIQWGSWELCLGFTGGNTGMGGMQKRNLLECTRALAIPLAVYEAFALPNPKMTVSCGQYTHYRSAKPQGGHTFKNLILPGVQLVMGRNKQFHQLNSP